jgi:cofilin
VTVNQECLETFQELKLRKKAKYIIFTLNKEKTEIIVEKTSSVNEYEDFLGDLPEAECRWAVYDFEFLNEENSKRNKIIFYSWYAFTLPPPPSFENS